VVTTDEQERRIDLAVAALRVIGIMTEDELREARERMLRVQDDPDGVYQRIADQRIAGSSGP
jgi:hypothetical protein